MDDDSLDLDFDPHRQELLDALAGRQQIEDLADQEVVTNSISKTQIIAAVERLYESFALKRRSLDKELKRFAPYLPHSSLGVDFLVGKLTAETLTERKSAAWALGRLGSHAAGAADALLRQMENDPENDYAGYALEEIPLDSETVERICLRLEQSGAINAHQYFRVLGDRIETERLISWLNASDNLRWEALVRLGNRCPELIREQLLDAMLDEDERIAMFATNILGNVSTCNWYFAELKEMSPNQRLAIAEALLNNGVDLSDYRIQLFRTVRSLDDPKLAATLVTTVQAFECKTAEDADACMELIDLHSSPEWKLRLAELLPSFHSLGRDEELIATLNALLTETSPYVRAAAVNALGKIPEETVVELLKRTWSDESELVKRAVLWNLAYRGPDALAFLVEQLKLEKSDRISSELLWILSTKPLSNIDVAPGQFSFIGMPLAESVLAAIRRSPSERNDLS